MSSGHRSSAARASHGSNSPSSTEPAPKNIIIIGGEGDLALRKLFPALYSLDYEGLLAPEIMVTAFGRGRYTPEEFFVHLKQWIEKSEYTQSMDEQVLSRFTDRVVHYIGDATSPDSFVKLEQQFPHHEMMIYLSTPPSIFAPVCTAMEQAHVIKPETSIVVEKPLGDSRSSFESIDSIIKSLFQENQIYRIDHYLGKETVQNLLALRFANIFFDPIWNRNYIDHVQITVSESIGVGGRWAFYDTAGALRDMVQNHLLQLLCLVSMEPPAKNKADFVRDEKLKVLRSLKPITERDVNYLTIRGQYAAGEVGGEDALGYRDEPDAKNARSSTETFVAIKAEIENARWGGVPFYLRTGKRLKSRYSEIVICFKPMVHKYFDAHSGRTKDNRLVIRLQPDEGVELQLVNKVPGLAAQTKLQSAGLDLSFGRVFDEHRSPSAYEKLLLDVIRGDQTLFMRSDELCAAWDWVDGITEGWNSTDQRVLPYEAGSWGPVEATDFLAEDRRRWFNYRKRD